MTGVKGKIHLWRFNIAYLNMALIADLSLALCVDLEPSCYLLQTLGLMAMAHCVAAMLMVALTVPIFASTGLPADAASSSCCIICCRCCLANQGNQCKDQWAV